MAEKILENMINRIFSYTQSCFRPLAAYGLVFLLVMSVAGCGKLLSESERIRILNERTGNHIQTEAERTFVLLYNDEVTREIKKFAQQLSNVSSDELVITNVYVLNTSWINAFVGPNGAIFITTGLLDMLSSRAELAFALSRAMMLSQHTEDIAEMTSEEVTALASANVGTFLTDFFASIANVMAYYVVGTTAELFSYEEIMTVEKLGDITSNPAFNITVHKGYSSYSELKADRLSAELLESAGYDIINGLKVLEKLEKSSNENPRITANSSLIHAKPGLTRRIAAYRDYIARRNNIEEMEEEEEYNNEDYDFH
jgi:predicted Zn-dependent protease